MLDSKRYIGGLSLLLALTLLGCGKAMSPSNPSSEESSTSEPTPAPTSTAPPTTPSPSAPSPLPSPSSGVVHSGLYVIQDKSNLVVDGDSFTSSNDTCLSIVNSSNITIRNASFIHCHGVGVNIYNGTNIKIENSYFEDLNGGVYAQNSASISVTNSKFKNVARAGKKDPSRGQFVQFNNVRGAGNVISFNKGINEAGKSTPEDLINLYETNGTSSSPVMIEENCFSGGGPSSSGGGIMTGDAGGSYVIVRNNTLVNPGQYGIAIAGGTNIQILNNKVYGKQQSFTNIGMYIWNQYQPACSTHTVSGNQVDFKNSSGATNNFWNAGNCSSTVVSSNNNFTNVNLSGLSCTLN